MSRTACKNGLTWLDSNVQINLAHAQANTIELLVYESPKSIDFERFQLTRKEDDWFLEIDRPLIENKYYTFLIDGQVEISDPYSKALSYNGFRSYALDVSNVFPTGFENDKWIDVAPNESIIYEVHVKDYSIDSSSGALYPGKYLGLAETSSFGDIQTGIDHLVDLGITHLYLMPIYDFCSVEERPEAFYESNNYNWGYDPEHYYAPEGSYATDSYDPTSRIYELKKLILECHRRGIAVVMDVVFNHTYKTIDSNFYALWKDFYRYRDDGSFSNGSGCGNEVATENPFVRTFIIDALTYWAEEYHIDGFRFDLLALMDRDTMAEIVVQLHQLNPNILLFGEPWMAEDSTLCLDQRIYPGVQRGLGFSVFNASFRDAIRGDNDGVGFGYLQGNQDKIHDICLGLMGSIQDDSNSCGFCEEAYESINYFNAHDNLIFEDKLQKMMPSEDHQWATKLAFSFILLAQGIPFFHAGNEFMRTKYGDANSYASSTWINGINWLLKDQNNDLFVWVKNLIRFRKENIEFFTLRCAEIKEGIHFYEASESAIIFEITKNNQQLLICINRSDTSKVLELEGSNFIVECVFGNDNQENNQKLVFEKKTTTIYKVEKGRDYGYEEKI